MVDLTGKHIIVTGATDGIGKISAIELAHMGADITLISRTESKLQATSAEIKQKTGKEADYIKADLSSMAEIRAAASKFKSRYKRLDVLLNNAGAVFTERKESVDGIELTIALNHISYFLLTHELLDLLKQTAAEQGEARIVNVSSNAHCTGMNWDDLQYQKSYNSFGAYGQSKCMNILFTKELARRLEGTNVTANALHPGFVATNFGENNAGIMTFLFRFAKWFAKTPEQGAETNIYLASSPDVKDVTGEYFADKKRKKSVPETYDKNNWTRLWEISEELIAIN